MVETDVLIVGAGVAGLSCARALTARGRRVTVLERSSRVGGRCSSKPAGSGPVLDFGPVFVHGDDPAFLEFVASLGGDLVPGWPRVVRGTGTPCQPAAFEPGQERWALKSGLGALAGRLADGLAVETSTEAVAWSWDADGFTVEAADGRSWRCRDLVWALAAEQTRDLLSRCTGTDDRSSLEGAQALLGSFASLPSLTVLARYPAGTPVPDWDLWYPESSRPLLLLSNEGSKRGLGEGGALLTLQSRPSWAAARLEVDREVWTRELLDEAGRLAGAWAAVPEAWAAHRWRYGRLGPSDHLVRPPLFRREASVGRWGMAGDLFDPDGGLQGAWRSGRALAARLGEPL